MLVVCMRLNPYQCWFIITENEIFNEQETRLTHGGQWHICASINYTIIGPNTDLSLVRRQAIISTNASLFQTWPMRTNFNQNTFSLQKMDFKIPYAKWQPMCLGSNVLKLSFATNAYVCSGFTALTHCGWNKWSTVCRRRFQMHFIQWK